MRAYTKKGTTVALFLHLPAEYDEAVSTADYIAEYINTSGMANIYEGDSTYHGFAEVRLTEPVVYDFDDDGTIIGWS